jgi:small subunit ribosomal protein S16
MSVKIRMKRMGRSGRPFYRLHAVDSRTRRDGRAIEELGFYDPLAKDKDKAVQLKRERIEYWLGVGAQPSETVGQILRKSGIAVARRASKAGA